LANARPFPRAIIKLNFAETICVGFASIHELWAVPVELGLALWLLQRQLGLAFLAPGAVAMFAVRCQLKNAGKALAFIENALIPFSVLQMCGIAIIAKYIGNAQKVWIEGIQTRVDVTASMLSSMKVQKLLSEPAPG